MTFAFLSLSFRTSGRKLSPWLQQSVTSMASMEKKARFFQLRMHSQGTILLLSLAIHAVNPMRRELMVMAWGRMMPPSMVSCCFGAVTRVPRPQLWHPQPALSSEESRASDINHRPPIRSRRVPISAPRHAGRYRLSRTFL